MSAKHHIPLVTNISYQALLIKPIFSVLAHAEKQFFFKTSLPVLLRVDHLTSDGWGGGGGVKERFGQLKIFLSP